MNRQHILNVYLTYQRLSQTDATLAWALGQLPDPASLSHSDLAGFAGRLDDLAFDLHLPGVTFDGRTPYEA